VDLSMGVSEMKTWNAFLQGEDRTEFTIEVQANSIEDAEREIEERYPDAKILEIYDPIARADEIYERAARAYDNDYLDDDFDY
jgi:hypothetical protein